MIELIPEELRTSTVSAILRGMVSEADWSRFPLLADAITDAGGSASADLILSWVLADPDNDRPREMWAEAAGGERAEFVGVQCEFSKGSYKDQVCGLCGANCGDDKSKYCRYGDDPQGKNSHLWKDERREYLRRRQRELLDRNVKWAGPVARLWHDRPTPHGNYGHSGCSTNPDGSGISNSPRWEWSRGFIGSASMGWADWLRVHESLYWHPSQRVDCPECDYFDRVEVRRLRPCSVSGCRVGLIPRPFTTEADCPDCRGDGKDPRDIWNAARTKLGRECPKCNGVGRIFTSLAKSAQPLTTVTLTSPSEPVDDSSVDWFVIPDLSGPVVTYRFDRVKCVTCLDQSGVYESRPHCERCGGNRLNEWTCEAWPTIVFRMPEANRGVPPMREFGMRVGL